MSRAPWDWLPYFLPPKEISFAGNAAAQQILTADPMRVYAMFSLATSAQPWNISLLPNVSAAGGLFLAAQDPRIILTQADAPALVVQGWFAFGPVGGSLTVITLSMSDWPTERMDAYEAAPTISDTIQRLNRDIRERIGPGQSAANRSDIITSPASP